MAAVETPTRRPGKARIALCITELELGGAERCLVEIATRLDPSQFEPVVYCLGPRPQGNPTSLVDRLEAHGIAVHCLGARYVSSLPWLLRQLRQRMASDAPDLVQTFLFHANVAGALAARRAGVRRIVSGIRVAERRAAWHLAVARWADRLVDRHVCVSESVREFSIVQGKLPAEKLLVIPNGVDLERFAEAKPVARESLGRTANRRLVVCVGRLDEQKGLDWLLKAMPRVFAEVSGVELALIGQGPARERLTKLAARLGIADRVIFSGFRDDVPEILAASEMAVLASRWEGMPNAVLEAMASGRPVVATDVDGVGEALGELAPEQVVPAEAPEEFARRVAAILTDSQLAQRLGTANQQRARQHFTLSAMVASYERLYGSLLSADGCTGVE